MIAVYQPKEDAADLISALRNTALLSLRPLGTECLPVCTCPRLPLPHALLSSEDCTPPCHPCSDSKQQSGANSLGLLFSPPVPPKHAPPPPGREQALQTGASSSSAPREIDLYRAWTIKKLFKILLNMVYFRGLSRNQTGSLHTFLL